MEEYIERVRRAAAERTGEPVFNGSVDHARIIAAAMFKHAHKFVDIFSGTLNARVYGPDDVLDEAEFFLSSPDHRVRVLLEDADSNLTEHHPFFRRFHTYKNLEIKVLPKSTADTISFHMLVADGDCYRFEQDKSKVAAIAAWGDAKGGKNLGSLFSELWSASKTVSLAPSAVPA